MALDLLFPITGGPVPVDHCYALYAALSRVVPAVHAAGSGVRFAPLTGEPAGRGQLALTDWSRLRLRVPDDAVRLALPLAGVRLDLAGAGVRVGVPSVAAVVPAATVAARIVTFKHPAGFWRPKRVDGRPADAPPLVPLPQVADPAWFLETARKKLLALGVSGEVSLPLITAGPRAGEYRRRVVRMRSPKTNGEKVVAVGYAVEVTGLSAADSLTLQAVGLGGRTRLGCGFFLPVREDAK